MLGVRIKQIRRMKGASQKELADVLGCSEAQISHIENGNRKISMDMVERLADFFKISYDSFFVKNENVANFRHNGESEDDIMDGDLFEDFKKFAKSQIYGDSKN